MYSRKHRRSTSGQYLSRIDTRHCRRSGYPGLRWRCMEAGHVFISCSYGIDRHKIVFDGRKIICLLIRRPLIGPPQTKQWHNVTEDSMARLRATAKLPCQGTALITVFNSKTTIKDNFSPRCRFLRVREAFFTVSATRGQYKQAGWAILRDVAMSGSLWGALKAGISEFRGCSRLLCRSPLQARAGCCWSVMTYSRQESAS